MNFKTFLKASVFFLLDIFLCVKCLDKTELKTSMPKTRRKDFFSLMSSYIQHTLNRQGRINDLLKCKIMTHSGLYHYLSTGDIISGSQTGMGLNLKSWNFNFLSRKVVKRTLPLFLNPSSRSFLLSCIYGRCSLRLGSFRSVTFLIVLCYDLL